ncbi:hypothetical protein ELQ35_18100 [Peribacillus cavernae]|uniref:YhcU family protein n=1 Tax=Peribacillus cavernae TaxID=1674310 RepID=A0A433HE72_9BACI|nr:DUF5365 family protein [Peribacillus cavernae]MDQ0219902.1 hypothetical protein [Peribacillus cavernae]RUQ26615.1 hypothetical protein ELQ35_18100 [Peribacillus cavernae]
MKIVFSSTPAQEQEIGNLVSFFYGSIFPRYFTEEEILHFEQIGVLQNSVSSLTYFGTLKDAFQVMTCLQVIMSILEKKDRSKIPLEQKFEDLFEINARILNDYGVFFPLNFDHFTLLKNEKSETSYLLYAEAANQYLI